MRNRVEIQERFLKEEASRRLGYLASDVTRIASLIGMRTREETIQAVIEEGKFFSEWAARDVELEVQTLLAEIQSFLAKIEWEWDSPLSDSEWKKQCVQRLRAWSGGLLKKAGFIPATKGNPP